jgi:hypothetical protein
VVSLVTQGQVSTSAHPSAARHKMTPKISQANHN